MVLVLPNLAEETLKPFLTNPSLKVEELGQKEVPLKVSNILQNKERIKYLTEEKGLKKELKDGYEYWQTIKVMKFSLNEQENSSKPLST
jgi:hypothetical protein